MENIELSLINKHLYIKICKKLIDHKLMMMKMILIRFYNIKILLESNYYDYKFNS